MADARGWGLMPEGDTIWRSAETPRAALVGRAVTAFESPIPPVASAARKHGVVGSEVAQVEARGKHLLMRFSSGAVPRTHQRMAGSWHLYKAESRWRKPAHLARVVVWAGDRVAVCFSAPEVELLSAAEAEGHLALRRLGPDLLTEELDPARALANLQSRGDAEIAVALLDQTALAGIGNVYKCEVLFLRRIDPFDRVAGLDDAALGGLIDEAWRQMTRNLQTDERRTTAALAPSRFWAYGRAGQPCRRRGTPIRRLLQGEQARPIYWCPRCQPARQG